MVKEKNSLLLEIISLLEPMGEITYLILGETLNLQKNEITFGKVKDDSIFLFDKFEEFRQIDSSILKTPDAFLKEATNAYWLATKVSSLKQPVY